MLPRFAQFLVRNRATLAGVAVGTACLGPSVLSLSLADSYGQIQHVDYVNLVTGPLAGFGVGYCALRNSSQVLSSISEFNQARSEFRNGIAGWPAQAQMELHRRMMRCVGKVGGLAGVSIYLLGSMVVMFAGLRSGDPTLLTEGMREYTTYGPVLFILTGAASGATAGSVVARASTSRMLWG
jgi:hypothetical protein